MMVVCCKRFMSLSLETSCFSDLKGLRLDPKIIGHGQCTSQKKKYDKKKWNTILNKKTDF